MSDELKNNAVDDMKEITSSAPENTPITTFTQQPENTPNTTFTQQPENLTNQPAPEVQASAPNVEPAYHFWAEQVAATQQNQANNNSVQQSNPAGYPYQPACQNNGYPPYQNNYNQNQPVDYHAPNYQNQQNYPLHYTHNPHSNTNYSEIPGASFSQQPMRGVKNKKKGKFKKGCKFVAYSAIFGLIAAAVFIGTNELYYSINPSARPAVTADINPTNDPSKLEIFPSTEQDNQLPHTSIGSNQVLASTDVSNVVEDVMPSIVTITSTVLSNSWYGQYETDGGGSGIIIDETNDEILIATNNHVVENAKKIMVTLNDGESYEATVKGTDSISDLAVIAVKISDLSDASKKSYQVAKLGDSDSIKVGQMAIAIGNALGYGQSVTVGYVSAKDREVSIDSGKMVLLQTDAAINPGNSGGALLNINGEVIGINSVKYTASAVEGMGFAIPISKATAILDELKTREVLDENEQGYLGVTITNITEEDAAEYNWPVGILVKEMTKDGAAALSGILPRDIITSINDVPVKTSAQLKEKVNSYRYGTTINVTVSRVVDSKFEELTFQVKLQQNPELNATSDKTEPDVEVPAIDETPENETNPFDSFKNFPWD